MPAVDPISIAQVLRRHEQALAERITDAFLDRHPDWITRYGDLARTRGIEDARFHLQFLGGAIESGSADAFRDYVHWTTRVLEARGIDRRFLRENLMQVGDSLAQVLTPDQLAVALPFVALPEDQTGRTDTEACPTTAADLVRGVFIQAILRGERRAAVNVASEALADGMPVLELYTDVFQASLYEIGRRWERNQITVAQEHMATAITQFVMAQIYDRLPQASGARGKAVLTGVPGELHHIGAVMVSDVLETHGWTVQYLGSNLPIPSVVATVRETAPDVLGISVTMLFNVHHAAKLIAEVRGIGRPIRILVGGAAFRVRGQWRDIGADDYAPDLHGVASLLCA